VGISRPIFRVTGSVLGEDLRIAILMPTDSQV
jgi:hypothetical protein